MQEKGMYDNPYFLRRSKSNFNLDTTVGDVIRFWMCVVMSLLRHCISAFLPGIILQNADIRTHIFFKIHQPLDTSVFLSLCVHCLPLYLVISFIKLNTNPLYLIWLSSPLSAAVGLTKCVISRLSADSLYLRPPQEHTVLRLADLFALMSSFCSLAACYHMLLCCCHPQCQSNECQSKLISVHVTVWKH